MINLRAHFDIIEKAAVSAGINKIFAFAAEMDLKGLAHSLNQIKVSEPLDEMPAGQCTDEQRAEMLKRLEGRRHK
jgi:hypothetical protein